MDIPIILITRDYEIFKTVNFNRNKSKYHIAQIKKIILQENLLHLHPILVNEKMEVIDGQHRLEAAKELNLEIYYIKDKISYEHILNSNLYQKKLALKDVIKFYSIKDGIYSYCWLYNHMERLNVNPKSILGLLLGSINGPLISFIKSGKFVLPEDLKKCDMLIKKYEEFLDFVNEKKIKPISMFSSSTFTVAFRNLILLTSFDGSIWLKKLENRWFDLKPQMNSNEWTRQLLSIYNWKNQSPLNYEYR